MFYVLHVLDEVIWWLWPRTLGYLLRASFFQSKSVGSSYSRRPNCFSEIMLGATGEEDEYGLKGPPSENVQVFDRNRDQVKWATSS